MSDELTVREIGDLMVSQMKSSIVRTRLTDNTEYVEYVLSKLKAGPGLLKAQKISTKKGKDPDNHDADDNSSGEEDAEKEDRAENLIVLPEAGEGENEDTAETFDKETEKRVMAFFEEPPRSSLKDVVDDLHNNGSAILKDGLVPHKHQAIAATAMLLSRQSPFKGMILADPPGLGKTLPALMAICLAKKTGHGPSVIVAPNPCVNQWYDEARRFLREPLRILLLDQEDVSPTTIFSFDIVITTYSRITAEFTRMLRYESCIKNYVDDTSEQPKRPYLSLLSGFYKPKIVRRPQATVDHLLGPLEFKTVELRLPVEDLTLSSELFERSLEILRKRQRDRGADTDTQDKDEKQARMALDMLIKAQQAVCHSELSAATRLEDRIKCQCGDKNADDQRPGLDKDTNKKLGLWLDRLKTGDRWRSARVTLIVETIKGQQGEHKDNAAVVFDESVLFLHILQIAFEKMLPKATVIMYDGSLLASERSNVLQKFKDATHPKILLMSRAAGGVGLDIQSANVILFCTPWWKKSWVDQAVGRVHGLEQSKTVFVYQVTAIGSHIEEHKLEKCEEKATIADGILEEVTQPAK